MTPHEALDELAAVVATVVRRIGDALPEVQEATRAVAADWTDPNGVEWAAQAARSVRALSRELDGALALAAGVARELAARRVDGDGEPVPDHASGIGARLGGVDGRRAEDQRGARIAHLDPDDDPGADTGPYD
jgi:ABC-type transporter Mla subunit MlaD